MGLMKKRPRLTKFFLMSLSLAFSFQANARTVKNVVILESGMSADPSDPNLTRACKRFRPTEKQISAFFSKADPVPRRFSVHDRYSACYASGTLRFDRFGEVKWSLSSGGIGSITWDEGETVDVFNRNNGWDDPNACTYGSSSVPEC